MTEQAQRLARSFFYTCHPHLDPPAPGEALPVSPLNRQENCGSERPHRLPELTQLPSGGTGTQRHSCSTPTLSPQCRRGRAGQGGGGRDAFLLSLLGPPELSPPMETVCPCGSPYSPLSPPTRPPGEGLGQGPTLTLQAEVTPSPPAHTMVSFTMVPHQSLWVHVAWSTTGCRPCCSSSAMGPLAGERAGGERGGSAGLRGRGLGMMGLGQVWLDPVGTTHGPLMGRL